MDLTLPAELASAYTIRPTRPADLDALYDLVVADRTFYTGECRVSRGLVGSWMHRPGPSLSVAVEARGHDGRIEHWWNAALEPGTSEAFAILTARPGLADVDALEDAAWATTSDWAAALVPDEGSGLVRTVRPAQDEDAHERLRRRGFRYARTFWAMGGDVPSRAPSLEDRPAVIEVSIEAAADPHQVHEILNTGFVGHYAYAPESYEDFVAVRADRAGHDPALWFVAAVDGEPVGAMILSRESEDRGALHVLELATLEHARGRGVGTALLHEAFETARREGLTRLELFVDSENTNGAPALYRRAGLDVMQATLWFERPLVTRDG